MSILLIMEESLSLLLHSNVYSPLSDLWRQQDDLSGLLGAKTNWLLVLDVGYSAFDSIPLSSSTNS